MRKSEKFFIWLGWINWRFTNLFYVFLGALDVLGLFFCFAPRIFNFAFGSIKGIASEFIGFIFLFLSPYLFFKGLAWKKKERNWKIAAHKGARLAIQNNQETSLFFFRLGSTTHLCTSLPILDWMEKEKQRAGLEKELARLKEELKESSNRVANILPEEIEEAEMKLAASEKELEAMKESMNR